MCQIISDSIGLSFCRFVDVNGTEYNPVRTYTNGPYGKTTIFTGPKVAMWCTT